MTKDAKIKLGIIGGVLLLILVVPFIVFGGGGGKAPAEAQITISFWNVFDDRDLYAGVIEQFQAVKPNIRINYKKYTDLKEFEADFINELAEGKGPDIVAIEPSWLLRHKGKLSPMPQQYFQKGNPSVFRETFVSGAAEDLILPENGGEAVYALPVSMDSLGVLYNRDLLLERIAKNEPAKDWITFAADAVQMARTNRTKTLITRASVPLGRIDNIARGLDILHLIMLQQGVSFYDATKTTATMANPVLLSGRNYYPANEALDFFASFAKEGSDNFVWSDALTAKYPKDGELGAFVRGEVGMMFGFSYQLKDVERLANEYRTTGTPSINPTVVKAASAPQILAQPDETRRATSRNTNMNTSTPATASLSQVALASYFPLAVTKNSKNKLPAWDFIDFLSGQDQQRFLFNKGKKLSARVDMIAEQAKDPIYGAFVRQNSFARSVLTPSTQGIFDAYKKQLDEVLAGRVDTIDATREIQTTWQCVLDKLNGRTPLPGSSC